jgi:dTDP-4-amino-4,6-dideoxygalactose transaminase
MTTDREDLYEKLYDEWAFGGESPAFMTLNYRMNELTAALGLAQLSRVDGYVAEYTRGLHTLDEAIRDCAWLRNRHVPEQAVQSGYIWVCTWEGDQHGLEYARFQAAVQELGLPLRFGFTGAPAYDFDFFRVSTAYHHPDCPIRCPYYEGDYRYQAGLCPTAEDLIPRLVMSGLIEVPPDEVKRRADLLRQAIELTERG